MNACISEAVEDLVQRRSYGGIVHHSAFQGWVTELNNRHTLRSSRSGNVGFSHCSSTSGMR